MKAVILAGGKGTRLQPYTAIFPKPLVPINDKPILEVVIEQLAQYGFKEITMAVGHLAELIITFFGDGSKFGVKIEYSREDKPLGTAGPLAMIKGLNETFLMMNGDVLSTIDYSKLIEYHKKNNAVATIALTKRNVNIDFGVVEIDDNANINKWIEKPTIDYLVSMGIYVLEPSVLNYIKPKEKLDLPDLIIKLVEHNEVVKGYIHDGYWLDIGRVEDYEIACRDANKLLGEKQ